MEISDYRHINKHLFTFQGWSVQYFSRPGMPATGRISPSTLLLAQHVNSTPSDRLLLYGCTNGALAVILANKLTNGEIWLTDVNSIAIELSQLTLQNNQIQNASITTHSALIQDQGGAFDTVVIDLPKGRKLVQRWLREAYSLVRPGGKVYLAGSNQLGIQSAIKDAESLFGQGIILGYKKGNRILRLIKTENNPPIPPWADEPGIALNTWVEFNVRLSDKAVKLYSLPGIFSFDHIDDGTQLLLDHMVIIPGARVLDLGCGYGVLGINAAILGAAHVDLVDVNLYAIAAAQKNLNQNAILNARAIPSDGLQAVSDQRYTVIVSNPPFHFGSAIDYQVTHTFIQQSWQALDPGGELWLVANQFIPYQRIMTQIFKSVTQKISTGRYHIIVARK